MLPRRAVVAISTTAIALVLLFSFRTPADAGSSASSGAAAVAVGQPTAQASVDTGSSTAGGSTSSSGGAATATAAPTTTAATGSSGTASGTYAGSVISTRYGNVQVQVTFENGSIVDVQALQLPSDDHHSAEISDRVAPVLRSAVLQAQSAAIDLVSGATYTSEAYVQSLQAALDQARG